MKGSYSIAWYLAVHREAHNLFDHSSPGSSVVMTKKNRSTRAQISHLTDQVSSHEERRCSILGPTQIRISRVYFSIRRLTREWISQLRGCTWPWPWRGRSCERLPNAFEFQYSLTTLQTLAYSPNPPSQFCVFCENIGAITKWLHTTYLLALPQGCPTILNFRLFSILRFPDYSQVDKLGLRYHAVNCGIRGGLVFKAHGILYHSTLGVIVIKKKKKGSDLADALKEADL